MRHGLVVVGRVIFAVAIAVCALWTALAFWYRLPMTEPFRALAAAATGGLGVAAIAGVFTRRCVPILPLALAFAGAVVWWSTITPPRGGTFAPDVAQLTTGDVNGDVLTLRNVRNFTWRSDSDFDARWEERRYDLTQLRHLDVFMSHWSGSAIAHMILSFGFEDGRQLAWSIEVRRPAAGVYSPIADAFKTDTLIMIAADERDVVRVRATVRGEDVQLYRLNITPELARKLLLQYVEDANAVAAAPVFYNSLTTNCTTTVVKMMHAIGVSTPFDWRMILNGYFPSLAYAHGAVDTSLSLFALEAAAHIGALARAVGPADDFSLAIRRNAPTPPPRSAPAR